MINKIREHTGIMIGVTAFGLILFLVGGDLLSTNSALFQGNTHVVGEVAGKKIQLNEFQQTLQENVRRYKLNYQKNPDAATMRALRDQTWQDFILLIANQREYDRLGIFVSEEEIVDMVQGDHVKDDIKQHFKNDSTGAFSKKKLQEYLQNIGQLAAQQQLFWLDYEQRLAPTRLHEKYRSLFSKSVYVTQAETEAERVNRSKRINVRYLYIPYDNLPDSSYSVTEKEAKTYLSAQKNDYQQNRSRRMYYITFPIIPSAKDSAFAQIEAQERFDELVVANQDSLFVQANSDGDEPYKRYTPDQLPTVLANNIENLTIGQTFPPSLQDGDYVSYKISDITTGQNEYARARHILIKVDDKATAKEKRKARKKANSLLRQIKYGADFEELAREHGSDGTASSGGDLGWFSRGRMVPAFDKATFDAKKSGLLPKIVETSFGFHLIKVTKVATRQVFIVSTLAQSIIARDETRNKAYQQAISFTAQCQDTTSFLSLADTLKIPAELATAVEPNTPRIGTLADSRQLVRWLYNTAEENMCSQIFELEKEFVAAVMVREQPKGTTHYQTIETVLKKQVLNQKKGTDIIQKLQQQPDATLDELVKLFPTGTAYVYSMSGLKFTDNFLRNVGNDPKSIGVAFSLTKEGDRTQATATKNGVLLFELTATGETDAETVDDIRKQLQSAQENRLHQNIEEAIKYFSNIDDKRYKFF